MTVTQEVNLLNRITTNPAIMLASPPVVALGSPLNIY